jgi:hypothetical protein
MKTYHIPNIVYMSIGSDPLLDSMSGLPLRGDSITDPTFESSEDNNSSTSNSIWNDDNE